MEAKRTPFYRKHVDAGAKIVEFAGYRMPMFYKGIVPEHLKVRESVGLFDLSHMGEFFLEGPGAMAFISSMTVNDPSELTIGQCQYSAMCYENGGIVDDLLVYRVRQSLGRFRSARDSGTEGSGCPREDDRLRPRFHAVLS